MADVGLEKCYGYYRSKLDTSSFQNRASFNAPEAAIVRGHRSNCVVAYQKYDDSQSCRQCFLGKFGIPMDASTYPSYFL
ncbi:unnamed protein product [Albugo candida]|uniref:Uncharacterized protein n=1 Tax=Albugo candida TaxID=65357 RepID=A0A024GBE5_9STRA|nr:unnamed protein product [Albugo candida]|eukprot:CCI44186.1 unnamed protein product [Albugo candida]